MRNLLTESSSSGSELLCYRGLGIGARNCQIKNAFVSAVNAAMEDTASANLLPHRNKGFNLVP